MALTSTKSINLLTEIPGPRSQELVRRREAAVLNGLYKATPLAIERGQGALVTDVDGNTLIDLVSGIGVLAVGHCPPEIVAAVQQQAGELIHFSALVGTYEPYVELCERLNTAVPISGPCKTLLGNSGAEGVENAIKIARAYTGRSAIIAFDGGYHGRTLLTLSLTSKTSFKKSFGPFAPEIYRAPFPYSYQCPECRENALHGGAHDCGAACYEQLERMLITHVGAENVAAIIIEPVQGEGGFIPVPPAYMQRLRALCDRIGAVLIADEVQCGFGRTGTLFAMEQMGAEPDIVVSAKSLAAGMPLSATTGRAAIMDAAHVGGVGGTYGGNPLACVAAIETMKLIERDGLLDRARHIGAIVRERAEPWQREIGLLGDVRGLGAMLALELVQDRATRKPAPDEALAVIARALKGGVITMRAGLFANCIRLLPPLVIGDDQLHEALDVLEQALRAADAEVARA